MKLLTHFPPLVGTLGKAELEIAAGMILVSLHMLKRFWTASVSAKEIAAVFTEHGKEVPLRYWKLNPFLKPDFVELVKRGFAAVETTEDGEVFTLTASCLERVASHLDNIAVPKPDPDPVVYPSKVPTLPPPIPPPGIPDEQGHVLYQAVYVPPDKCCETCGSIYHFTSQHDETTARLKRIIGEVGERKRQREAPSSSTGRIGRGRCELLIAILQHCKALSFFDAIDVGQMVITVSFRREVDGEVWSNNHQLQWLEVEAATFPRVWQEPLNAANRLLQEKYIELKPGG